ncbi:hypothetical protein [Deinococcus ruber]|uniref:VCBS repeat-containing protein n=1 Tax=Deinococcus ruber TaxID=1848197 RepID=A0A918C5A7_9DEIO|nr:hypothetical protein [Deinococcus ruber]GGR05646.1 hypothetical protein GCM10008957_18240 [Deinococcus ruber]
MPIPLRWMLPALTLLLSTAVAQSDPPPVKSWGRYTLQTTPNSLPTDGEYVQGTLKLKQGNKTLLSIKDDMISTELQPLRPGGLPELVITLFSGGAHCCTTTLIYTQDNGRLENIGRLEQGNYPASFRDLNKDGTKEIMFYSDSLAYYDWSFASSPAIGGVLGWDGLRLADRTRAYAYIPGNLAADYLKQLQAAMKTSSGNTEVDDEGIKSQMGGYYANMVVAGRGLEAEKVLNTQIFPRVPKFRTWFTQHRGDLIGATYALTEGRLSIFSGAVYPPPNENQDSP